MARRTQVLRYGTATLCCGLAVGAGYGSGAPVSCLLLSVIIASYFYGRGPGLLSIVLSTLALDFFFVPPLLSFHISSSAYLRVLLYVAIASVTALIVESRRRTMERSFMEISQARDRLQRIIDTIPTQAWRCDANGSGEFFNQPWLDFTGLSLEEACGSGWSASIHPDDRPGLLKRWEAVVRSGQPAMLEARIRRFDGQYRWFLFQANPATDDLGKVTSWYGTNTDIDDLKLAEETLRSNERDLRMILNTIPGMISISTGEGVALLFNQQALDFTGKTFEEMKNGWPSVVHPDDLERVKELWFASIATGKPFEVEYRLKRFDGNYRWFQARGVPDKNESGEICRWYGVFTDIEDLKKGEIAVRARERELRLLVDTIPAMINVISSEGSPEFFNKTFVDFAGKTPEELKRASVVVHEEDLPWATERWLQAKAAGTSDESVYRLRRFDGEFRRFKVRAEPLRGDNGEILRWYGLFVDIEDLLRAEERHQGDQKQIRRIIDAIPEQIVVLGPENRILYTNRALTDFAGISEEDAHRDGSEIPGLDKLHKLAETHLRNGEPFQLEMQCRRADGQNRWLRFEFKPLLDDEGMILRWYATGTDIDDLKRAEERVQSENVALREELNSMFEEIVGTSDALQRMLVQVSKVAPSDSTVLILGETGTGKELVARAIHKRSTRSENPFIRVNCAAIPPSLIASELFGHEKGAFTGAVQRRIGRFELAQGGTILLDEVGELPPESQISLLRVLQERELERVGGGRPIPVDVRVLAATNRDLQVAVESGFFRQDLYYRLNVFPILVPPLRERRRDVPLLVEYFMERYARKTGKKITGIERKTLQILEAYDWPGNIRELQNVVERAVLLCDSDKLTVDASWLLQQERANSGSSVIGETTLTRMGPEQERELIEAALKECRGRLSGPFGAAAKLGIPRQTLQSKISTLGINKNLFRND